MNTADDILRRTGGDTETAQHTRESLDIAYIRHRRVDEMVDIVRYCLGTISLEFDHWGESNVKGPGFYLAITSGTSIETFADPMGVNYWPTDVCRNVLDGVDRFYQAAVGVASEADGAVVASIDGVLQPQMVRLKDPSPETLRTNERSSMGYTDWMGSRHMSALDTSMREDVVAAVTLSEENGRVTVFADGDYRDYERHEIGGKWRSAGRSAAEADGPHERPSGSDTT
jgi:diadenylate cyclase